MLMCPELSKRSALSLTLFILFSFSAFSQEDVKDSLALSQDCHKCITMEKSFGAYVFYQDGQRLSFAQVVDAVGSVEAATSQIKSAKSNNGIASVLGFAGGFCVGWPLGTALGGGEPNWALAAVGAGLIVVAMPISNRAMAQAKSAIDIYNGRMPKQSFWQKKSLDLMMKDHQVGLRLRF